MPASPTQFITVAPIDCDLYLYYVWKTSNGPERGRFFFASFLWSLYEMTVTLTGAPCDQELGRLWMDNSKPWGMPAGWTHSMSGDDAHLSVIIFQHENLFQLSQTTKSIFKADKRWPSLCVFYNGDWGAKSDSHYPQLNRIILPWGTGWCQENSVIFFFF